MLSRRKKIRELPKRKESLASSSEPDNTMPLGKSGLLLPPTEPNFQFNFLFVLWNHEPSEGEMDGFLEYN